ncbi:MAG: hypothetical protein VYA67_21880 [Actinomycetota bacterium]|nr:hypothetical protein [Actinomycetota bacterium]
MALTAAEVNVEERKAAGRAAAIAKGATQRKELREGLEDDYPYTYWYWVGWNEYVDANA